MTEEQLMREYKAKDMVDAEAAKLTAGTHLKTILQTIAEADVLACPVVDDKDRVIGVVALDDLKQTFVMQDLSDWLVAYDLMRSVPDWVTEETSLEEALTRMKEQGLDYLVVVDDAENRHYRGLLGYNRVLRRLSREVVERRKQAGEED